MGGCPFLYTVLSGVQVPVLIIENCAFFARESPRYLYSWGTTQRELKRCSNIASWAPLKIRHEGLKIESPGPQNGSLRGATSRNKNCTPISCFA